MKVKKGRGIQFFKLPKFSRMPVLNAPKKFVVNTYNFSKEQFANLLKKGKKK